jgi:multiple sugar transport system ATP-binding protein
MAKVAFRGVSKRFGDLTVVDKLNLVVNDEEFLVLVGPSGCGKSTTLRLLAGLEDASDGEILIGDKVVNDLPPRDRDIAMVFQSYALYPHMSVFDNLAFGLRNRGYAKNEVDKRVREAAETLDIGSLLERRPKQLSGGQRQRVALGRAIVREPAVFLMDEPLSNLDAQLRVTMRTELVKLHRRIRSTFVYVTHDQVEALTMGTRIAVLRKGVLEQVGTADDLYAHPVNQFVAGFIGSPAMNFLRGRVQGTPDALAFASSAFEIPLPGLSASPRIAAGSEVILGIRPEHLSVPNDREKDSAVGISAEVEVVEPTGGEAIITFNAAGVELIGRVGYRHGLKVGNHVRLGVDLGQLYLFDAATERAIR